MKLKLFLLFLMPLLGILEANACVCFSGREFKMGIKNQQQIYEQNDVIFRGKVTDIKKIEKSPEQKLVTYDIEQSLVTYNVRFTVHTLFKGKPNADSVFLLKAGTTSCDLSFKKGEDWLIIANYQDSILRAANCTPAAQFREGALQHTESIVFQLFLLNKLKKRNSFKLYYSNGKVATKGRVRAGALDGEIKCFNKYGRRIRKEVYKEGILQEYVVFYYKTGKLQEKTEYIKFPDYYTSKYYHPNGKLADETIKKDDIWVRRTYDENGILISEKDYNTAYY